MESKWELVKDGRSLRPLINNGYISKAKYENYPFVDCDIMWFTHKGIKYIPRYIDGNFYQLIYKQIK